MNYPESFPEFSLGTSAGEFTNLKPVNQKGPGKSDSFLEFLWVKWDEAKPR